MEYFLSTIYAKKNYFDKIEDIEVNRDFDGSGTGVFADDVDVDVDGFGEVLTSTFAVTFATNSSIIFLNSIQIFKYL